MKKINNSPRVILTCLVIILFALMAMGSIDFPWAPEDEDPRVIDYRREAEAQAARDRAKVEDVNSEIMRCTGKNLTSEEMSQHIKEFEKVQKKWSKKEIESESMPFSMIVPDLRLEMSGEHEQDEKTRYDITPLEKDQFGFYTGIKVSVLKNSSDSEDESESESESQEKAETTATAEAAAGLPAKEVEGAYTTVSVLTVRMKGKDEDEAWREIGSEDVTATFDITAVDENTIRLDLYGVKFGEGPYDPATGICEFKIASEFNEAMKTAKPDDRTRQLTFSKDNEQIKFKVIIVGGNDDDSVMLGVKEE
ncbi:MAG: hypothetical protein J6N21_09985 [Butyrivibrio sp.]|nr:hypothetical protein [Butyrivibrio sp.]